MSQDKGKVVKLATDSPPPTDGGATPTKEGKGSKKKTDKPVDWGRFNELMENFVLIYSTDTVYDCHNRLVMKINALRLAYGSDYVKMWLNSDLRRMILPEQLVFDPSDKCQPPCINLFNGFEISARAGTDISPIMELLHHLCANSAEKQEDVDEIVFWVLSWLALPLQRCGTKMRSALVFHGPQGAGKNLLFEIVAAIYGRYAMVVGQDQLEDKFNDWASQKLFLIGDEVVARAELYHQKNKLKAFITGETIQINPKNLPLRTERNHCNVVFLSNEHQPLGLEPGDRRYLVVYTPPRRDDDLYKRVADCIQNGGTEAFYDFLLHLDLGGFTEFDIPPMTSAKKDLIMLGLKPAERFCYEWLEGLLPLPLSVCSAGQLYEAFTRWARVNGERFTPAQQAFSDTVGKTVTLISKNHNKQEMLSRKKVRLVGSASGQSFMSVWIPEGCSPKDGQSIGAWAIECVDIFQESLGKFYRHGNSEGAA